MPAGASEDFLFCAVEIDSLLLLLLFMCRYNDLSHTHVSQPRRKREYDSIKSHTYDKVENKCAKAV